MCSGDKKEEFADELSNESENFSAVKLPEFSEVNFYPEGSTEYKCATEVEKMSKSMYNVVNPDDVIEQYGADTLRMYEMFLGPLEMSKPWDTNGIDGVHKFLKKFWRLFHGADFNFNMCTIFRDCQKLITVYYQLIFM